MLTFLTKCPLNYITDSSLSLEWTDLRMSKWKSRLKDFNKSAINPRMPNVYKSRIMQTVWVQIREPSGALRSGPALFAATVSP